MKRFGLYCKCRVVFFCSAIFLFLLLFPSTRLLGQMSARGLGMGGAYTALARGIHAPMWNAANLGLPDNSAFSLSIISFESGSWNNSVSLGMYNQYNGEYLSSRDIEDILGRIPDDGFCLDAEIHIRTLSFSVGRFALAMGADAGSHLELDKTFFEIPLKGTGIGEVYSFSNSDGHALGVGVVSLSYGQPLNVAFADAFSLGGTVKALYGGAYGQVDRSEIDVATHVHGIDLDCEYEVTYAYNGDVGWGLDLGSAAKFGEKWTVSLGLANVLGSIKFSNNVKTEKGFIRIDTLDVEKLSDIEDELADSTWTIDAKTVTTKLPMILRLGCAYQIGSLILAADYCQGFVNEALSSTRPQFSLGTEWSGLSWLPLRAGLTLGGRVGFGTAFGFGIRPGGFVLDIGVMNRGFVSPKSTKGLIVAVELGINLERK